MNLEEKARERAERIIRMVRTYDPELKYPGKLTDEIMGSLEDIAEIDKANRKSKTILLNINFRRLVAAAAILLLGVLGYEQYIVLDRINHLEMQLEQAALKGGPAASSSYMNTWETRAMLNFRNIKNNNRSLSEKVREVREMMMAIDRNSPDKADTYQERAINKYNSMIMR